MPNYRVTVFGAGSVGLCIAAHFVKAGARVSLLVRDSSIEGLRQEPIVVSGLLGDHSISPELFTLCDAASPTYDVLNSEPPRFYRRLFSSSQATLSSAFRFA